MPVDAPPTTTTYAWDPVTGLQLRSETDTLTDGDVDATTDYTYTFDAEGRVTNTHVVVWTDGHGAPEDHDVEQTWGPCGLTSSWERRSTYHSRYRIAWFTDGYQRTEIDEDGYDEAVIDHLADPVTGQPLFDRTAYLSEDEPPGSYTEKYYDAFDTDNRLLSASTFSDWSNYTDPSSFVWNWAYDEDGREIRYLIEAFRGAEQYVSTELLTTWTCP